MPKPGELLGGRYRLDDRIAAGGMGEVWSATDTVLSRPVAVKTLLGGRGSDPGFLRRFRHEARTMAALRHPGVVAVYDFGDTEDDSAYLVMAKVDGQPLNRIIGDRGQLSVTETMSIVAQAGRALQAAHDAGVIHRDVKPGNLIIEPNGTVVLVDFGVARSANSVTLTGAREVVGTALYIAPEQVSKQTTGPAADIYALGGVAYHCLTGRPPFLGDNPLAVALQHVTDEPPPLDRDVPRAVRDLVGIALAKQPEERFPSAAAMATAAEAAVAESAGLPATSATLTNIAAATGALTATAGMPTGGTGAGLAGAAGAAAAANYLGAAQTSGAGRLSGAGPADAAALTGSASGAGPLGGGPASGAGPLSGGPASGAGPVGGSSASGAGPLDGGAASGAGTTSGTARSGGMASGGIPGQVGGTGPGLEDTGADRNAATQKVAAGAFAGRAMVGVPRFDEPLPSGPAQDGHTMADGSFTALGTTMPPGTKDTGTDAGAGDAARRTGATGAAGAAGAARSASATGLADNAGAAGLVGAAGTPTRVAPGTAVRAGTADGGAAGGAPPFAGAPPIGDGAAAGSRRRLMAVAAAVLVLLGLGAVFALADPLGLFGDESGGGNTPSGVQPSVAVTSSPAQKGKGGSNNNGKPRQSSGPATTSKAVTSAPAAGGGDPDEATPTGTGTTATTAPTTDPTTAAPTESAGTGDDGDADNSDEGSEDSNQGSGGN